MPFKNTPLALRFSGLRREKSSSAESARSSQFVTISAAPAGIAARCRRNAKGTRGAKTKSEEQEQKVSFVGWRERQRTPTTSESSLASLRSAQPTKEHAIRCDVVPARTADEVRSGAFAAPSIAGWAGKCPQGRAHGCARVGCLYMDVLSADPGSAEKRRAFRFGARQKIAKALDSRLRGNDEPRRTRLPSRKAATGGYPRMRSLRAHQARKPNAKNRATRQTLRVATAGGTRDARVAGPSTASWPSSHRHTKPTGR